ncbi:MAG: TonB-dependent receptor domain-containing protein [bacterium]
MRSKFCTLFTSILLVCSFYNVLYGGITGTLSGLVRDKETGNILPGASIVVEGTTMGAMADKNGFYMIQNLPAGTYDVSVIMIGYSKLTMKDVKIYVDLNTELNFYLSTEVLPLEEVVVTKKRELIQSEITSSTYFVSGEEINDKLPIDSFQDATSLLPGVVGNHFRGGRETELMYMLDGLPLQGGLSREISSYFPNSSIVEMMVQTGGFTAEYGQATSGIINVVTKHGGSQVEGEVKVYTDFLDTGITDNDNTRRLEFNIGGPLTIGLGGPIINANYFISADLNLSDTPWRKQMRKAFDSPIFKNYNINSKLSFNIGNSTILALQGLISNWNWRQFDPQWSSNLEGLAEHRHYSHRLSASLTHTFSPRLFATLRTARYAYKKSVLGSVEDDPPKLVFENPGDATSPILSGTQPWEEETKENVDIIKFDVVGQLSAKHLLRTGFDLQYYDLRSQGTRFSAVPLRGVDNSIGFAKATNNYGYHPNFFALYIQDKFEVNGITANFGVRYDVFSPRISIEQIPQEFQEFRAQVQASPSNKEAMTYTPLSPRLGVSIPLSDHERLHVNYGWYYQMPPLYYLYSNADHKLTGYWPIIGNVDLEPIKTVSSEFSYKRVVSENLLFVITGFTKQFTNLVDSQSFVLPDSLIDSDTPTAGFTRFTNTAFGRAAGLEITLQKRITKELSGRVSYTYMKATGTSSTAEDNFNVAVFGAPDSQNKEFPLSWDQRHSIILDADFENRNWRVNVLYRLFSPLPFTEPGSTTPNNARMSWRSILDIKVVVNKGNILSGRMKPFFEIRNLFNEKNVVDQPNDTGIRAYQLFDPISSDYGRRLRLGMTLDF